ncbi:MAG: hypothetical protein IT479_11540 [Xanthomonadales bacterium]|nr:hypothetical protein [Xanthomonadales bacterium]
MAMNKSAWCLAAILASPLAPGAAAAEACLPQSGMVCAVTGNIHVYASSEDQLRELQIPVAAAQSLFTQHFSRAVPKGAVIAESQIGGDQARALKQSGLRWVLPWLDQDARQRLLAASIRSQLRSRLPEASDAAIEQMVAQSLPSDRRADARAGAESRVDAAAPSILEGSLQHEIGHLLFIQAYFDGESATDDASGDDAAVYGAAGAPDWLDEVSAILLEDPALADARRRGFSARVRQCHRPPQWSHFGIGVMEPVDDRRNGATSGSP